VLLCHSVTVLQGAAHAIFIRVLIIETSDGHIVSDFTMNGMQVMHKMEDDSFCQFKHRMDFQRFMSSIFIQL
jgi:hypothetical protein